MTSYRVAVGVITGRTAQSGPQNTVRYSWMASLVLGGEGVVDGTDTLPVRPYYAEDSEIGRAARVGSPCTVTFLPGIAEPQLYLSHDEQFAVEDCQ